MGIGIVGAGDIVKNCHLPAYRMAGFQVIGIFDIDTAKAQAIADLFAIPHVFPTLEAMLDHPDIQIIDIAVPAKFQLGIVEKVAARGKHMLCQKPLAESYEDAKRIEVLCEKAHVKAAVNQQMRWSPGIQASRSIISRGWLGELTQASIQVNVFTEWELWPWITKIEQLEVMYHSIHYLDAIRYLFGTPESIYADGVKFPGQVCTGETRTLLHMKYSDERRGLVHDNHNNWAPQDDWYATFRFEGTDGVIKGTNGALYNYPVGRSDTLQYLSKHVSSNVWLEPQLEGRWFPDAFMGPMGELMLAIEEQREPDNSVTDNLRTLQMVFAAYRSMEEDRPVKLLEITEG
jgi:predicted dehydrogenase